MDRYLVCISPSILLPWVILMEVVEHYRRHCSKDHWKFKPPHHVKVAINFSWGNLRFPLTKKNKNYDNTLPISVDGGVRYCHRVSLQWPSTNQHLWLLYLWRLGFAFAWFDSRKKSNLHYTRGNTLKRVSSGGAHLRGLAPGQHSPKETAVSCWRHCVWFDRLGNQTPADLLRR